MSSQAAPRGMVVRRTNARKGRNIAVTPESSPMKHLSYGRIILDRELPAVSLETGPSEAALICLSGAGRVEVAGQTHDLGRYDTIYLPRDSSVRVSTTTAVDFAECSAPVDGLHPVQVTRYADVEKDGSLKFSTGGPSAERTVNILIGKNVQAGRLLAGVTSSRPGNWTSWPPHEHGAMLEELYVYYDMPPPAFGVQFVYTNPEEPELVTLVRDGDAVLMPRGYHPNVSVPGHPINFLWIMAAHREVEDRQFGVVTVQPGFDQAGSGLEASHK
jgi:5-deoxy-glucuronate isomerase